MSQWLLAGEAATELLFMKAMVLSVAPLRYSHLVGEGERWPKEKLPVGQLKNLIWAVESVGQYAPNSINCLPRALALQRMLRRRGASGTIRFGVKKEEAEIKAHAWLVLENKVLIGYLPDLAQYIAFPVWPESLARSKVKGRTRAGWPWDGS